MKQYKKIQESLTHFTEEPKGAGNNTKTYKNPSLHLSFNGYIINTKTYKNPSLTSLKNQWYMKQYKKVQVVLCKLNDGTIGPLLNYGPN